VVSLCVMFSSFRIIKLLKCLSYLNHEQTISEDCRLMQEQYAGIRTEESGQKVNTLFTVNMGLSVC
jgi:hypothetical protein